MKNFRLSIVAVAIILAGCAKEKDGTTGDKNGTLTIAIKSDKLTRALVDGTNTADVVKDFESNVSGFSAYVFDWDNGDLEAKATSADGQPTTITGLNTAGAKRVVVIANGDTANHPNGSIPQFASNPNYSRLAEGYVALADQSFTDFTDTSKGFLMTGENPSALQLTPGSNTASITVKRVMAKVQLGDITFDGNVQLTDLAKFNLTGASIQRAAGYSTLGTGDITNPISPVAYMGGETGSISQNVNTALANTPLDLQSFLTTLYTTKLGYSNLSDPTISGTLGAAETAQSLTSTDVTFSNPGFWYVLPNNDSNHFTLLTLKGSYNGVDFYYPIEINDPDATGSTVDGTYVKRNTIYTINLNFKNFTGITDPDVPGVAASLEVTVVPAPWAGPIIQNATW